MSHNGFDQIFPRGEPNDAFAQYYGDHSVFPVYSAPRAGGRAG
ncbi:hypothetical protein [Nocardia goodfellowii]|uniref:Uncharacterized protein n=1 Tax=Nocardia goodfellowii TaxID=882446 RepID=A0ABS4QPH2_9NOCA|nr:hypothetical protein [Nocardia goodfellowii]MBP2192998.1 hypothetical protein [Nocardia goodfellowii]